MVLFAIIAGTIHAATEAHSDWKHGVTDRDDLPLVYKPVYKLTTAIERQVNPRKVAPSPPPSPVSSESGSTISSEPSSHSPTGGSSRRRRRRSRAVTDIERELKQADDPPPPYPGAGAVVAPPRYQA